MEKYSIEFTRLTILFSIWNRPFIRSERRMRREKKRLYLIFITHDYHTRVGPPSLDIRGREKMATPSWIYNRGLWTRAICKYTMIHWILAYKHPIFIRQAFLRHPATSLPRAHSPPTPSSRYRLRRRGRRDRNLLFLNFSATPRARALLREISREIVRESFKISNNTILRKIRGRRYRSSPRVYNLLLWASSSFEQEFLFDLLGFPFDEKGPDFCLIFSHDRRSRAYMLER